MIGLLSKESVPLAVKYLVEDIRDNDSHISTGFMGVSYILAVLTENGETETAFRLLLQESFPSWLYPVSKGATTIWERWDGWNEEKGFQNPAMNSFNHYALGSVGEWLYRFLAGIDIPEGFAGFQRFLIRPKVGEGISHVNCRYKTLYGWVESSWKYEEGDLTLFIEIPVNTSAEIIVPLSKGGVYMDGVRADGKDSSEDELRIHAGSGRYEIKSFAVERESIWERG
jgi:alpha-L-rhamnosidase